jgi:hypothetical protein
MTKYRVNSSRKTTTRQFARDALSFAKAGSRPPSRAVFGVQIIAVEEVI